MLDAYCSGRLDAKCSTTHYRLRAVIYINILGPRIAFVFVCRRNVSVHTSACSDISSYLGLCCVLSSKCSQCAHTCVQWYLIIFGPVLCVTPRSSVSVHTRLVMQQLCTHTPMHDVFKLGRRVLQLAAVLCDTCTRVVNT